MKLLTALFVSFFAFSVFAADAQPAKHPEPKVKAESNCVTKDKKGNCPAEPKSAKPTPKKKAEAPK